MVPFGFVGCFEIDLSNLQYEEENDSSEIKFNGVDENGNRLFSFLVNLDHNIDFVEASFYDCDGDLLSGDGFYIGENATGVGGVTSCGNPCIQEIDTDLLIDSLGEALDPSSFVGVGSYNGIYCDGRYTLKIKLVDIEGNEKKDSAVVLVDDLVLCGDKSSSSSFCLSPSLISSSSSNINSSSSSDL